MRELGRTVIAACILMPVMIVCAQVEGSVLQEDKAPAVDEAYKQANEARRKAEPFEEKISIMKEFLGEYPESPHTVNALGLVFYYQGTELGDYGGAVRYAESIRSMIGDPEIALQIDKWFIRCYGEAGMPAKMGALADRLDGEGRLRFGDYWGVIEGAVDNESWEMAIDYCGRAEKFASADTFRADYPDNEYSDEEAERAGRNRKGMLLVKRSWAVANLGKVEEALEGYEQAKEFVRHDYFGMPRYGLQLHWAGTLLKKKDYRGAIERFAMPALVMRNETAVAGLKEAYAGLNGGTDRFDSFAADLHRKTAKVMDDFDLPDYGGERHTFAGLKGDVTLVLFWSPT